MTTAAMAALHKVAHEFRSAHLAAIKRRDYHAALQCLLSSLVWRAAELALRLGLSGFRVDAVLASADSKTLALAVRTACRSIVDPNEGWDKRGSLEFKARLLIGMIESMLDVIDMLESWRGLSAEEHNYLALRAFELGRTEIELDLAEGNHWERVDRLQSRKVGRQPGWTSAWHEDAIPFIQACINADRSQTIVSVMRRLDAWLTDYRPGQRDFHRPDFESLRKTLQNMSRRGFIHWEKLPVAAKGEKRPTGI